MVLTDDVSIATTMEAVDNLKNTADVEGDLDSKQQSQQNEASMSSQAIEANRVCDKLVPQLAHHGVTERDLRIAIKVLNAVATLDPQHSRKRKVTTSVQQVNQANDGLSQFRELNLRSFRKSLSACLDLHNRLKFDGQSEEQYYERRLAERTLKRQKMAERVQQKKYVAATDLRRGRMDKLERLKEEGRDEEEVKMLGYLVPDGHVETTATEAPLKLLEHGNDDTAHNYNAVLPNLRSCYTCKVRFRNLHHFYDQLCPTCAPFNYSKRHQTADLSGKVAIVTGARVKIGFQVCLKLLRAGCTVVATTRFPNTAVHSFRREEDWALWKGRLHVYGLDLRDVTGLEAFTRYLKVRYGERGIDVLINNACQTVRRPGGYYIPLVEREGELWRGGDEDHRSILSGCVEFERIRRRLVMEHGDGDKISNEGKLLSNGNTKPNFLQITQGTETGKRHAQVETVQEMTAQKVSRPAPRNNTSTFERTGLSHSAVMSQLAVVPEDMGIDENVMPAGLADINGHQLDLRKTNSWLLKMDQVSTPELMECMFINAIAPFVLNSRLTPLMESPSNDPNRPDRYIINVSAMEGKFYRYKMPNHPHTNMAKAALNMLTRTSSEDLATKSRIFMNSVDTGWINDENPLEKASKIAKTNHFQTPIDEIDAAARILDPVFVGVNSDVNSREKPMKDYGRFFKDYKQTEW